MRGKLVHELELLVWVSVWGWVRVMVEFGTSSAFRGWVRVRVLGYGFGVRGRKVKSRDCLTGDARPRATHVHDSLLEEQVRRARSVDGRLSTYK